MTALVTALCFLVYFLGYTVYARYLARRVFQLDPAARTPAHALRDEVDYVPTRPVVLFGHHYASITGLSPMLGPAVAVIWGWAPALLWVVLGAVFVGCVHDFGALVVSMRARGMSIGKVTEGIIGPRAKTLFHLIIFFGVALAMGVFVYVIAVLFSITPQWDPERPLADPSSFPTAVLPSAALMLLAAAVGWLVYRRGFRLGWLTAVGFVLTLAAVWAGVGSPPWGCRGRAGRGRPSGSSPSLPTRSPPRCCRCGACSSRATSSTRCSSTSAWRSPTSASSSGRPTSPPPPSACTRRGRRASSPSSSSSSPAGRRAASTRWSPRERRPNRSTASPTPARSATAG